jgi:hypothetical protein
MKKRYFLLFCLITSFSFGQTVFINEIHYDDIDGDNDEGFEIAGQAGVDLGTGFSVVLYNGNNGSSYNTIALSGVFADQQGGYGTLSFTLPTNGIQNGSPDGLALVAADGTTVLQFLSYEGVFSAIGGPADGMTSIDIGVAETNSTPEGESLQLVGTGTEYGDFTWIAPVTASFGSINTNQVFSATASIKEDDINGFSMYPNPVVDGILKINTFENAEKTIQIFDVLGKKVLSRITKNEHISVATLNSGIYILKVTEHGKTATRKLVIK